MKIECGIPVPERRRAKYPFAQLAVGESFSLALSGELAKNGRPIEQNRLSAAACRYGRRHGKAFALRVVDGYVRCWRTK